MVRRLILLFFMIGTTTAHGQVAYIFNRLSSNNGLNTNKVNCVWQDKKGFLWVGTENGLQRFDGRKFINFRITGTEYSLPPYGVDQILGAAEGKLWLRQGNLIGQFDPVSFNYFSIPIILEKQLPTQSELNLFCDSKGNTFLCTHKTGLLYYDQNENTFTSKNLPIMVPEGWTVNSLFEDTITGDYWISSDRGLALYQSSTRTLTTHDQNPRLRQLFENNKLSSVYSFFVDAKRTYWIISWDFRSENEPVLIHYDPSKNKILNDIAEVQTSGTEYQGPFWVNETRHGQIWFGGLNILICYDSKLSTFIQNKKVNPDEYDIKFREVKQMFEDRESNIWLSSDNGLYVVSPEQQNIYNVVINGKNSRNDIQINAIQETQDLENWIGTWENGIVVFDKMFKATGKNLYETIKGKNLVNYKQVWDLYQHSRSGLIWSGCQNGTMVIFDPHTKKPVKMLEPPVFQNVPIRQIMEDREGNLFFGTQNGRVAKWKNGTEINNDNFEVIRDFNSIIFLLFKDNVDRIWVGTRNRGLFVMDPSGKNVQYHFNGQSGSSAFLGNRVYDVVQYNDSIFFVSTGFLNILNINTGKVQTLTQYDGLPGAGLTQMLLDDEGVLWFTNNNGLGNYNYKKNLFTLYSERNGIIMANKLAYTKYKMRNGEMWFGGENSLFGFRPETLKYKTAPPNVTITDFKLFNKFIPLDSLLSLNEIHLEPDQNSFTLYFSSLSYRQQDKLIYYYKLDGVDRNWVRSEPDLAANYTTLKPGNYIFSVKCINMQGTESANATILPITILPHFYQTGWFSTLVILLITSLTYFIYKLRLNRLLAVERVRNKVARDLHDDVGSTLSTINILSSMAKTKLLTDPVKTSEYITKITDNSQQMMEAMDDIVWSIKPNNDSMQRIVARMREYASGILEAKNIELYFRVDDNIGDLKLNMETRRDVFLIFKEAINNIAKYAHCSRVDVQITHESKKLFMAIADNGNGFNVKLADSGNGLGNMQKRAEALRGTINISSKTGAGTEISLQIPVNT